MSIWKVRVFFWGVWDFTTPSQLIVKVSAVCLCVDSYLLRLAEALKMLLSKEGLKSHCEIYWGIMYHCLVLLSWVIASCFLTKGTRSKNSRKMPAQQIISVGKLSLFTLQISKTAWQQLVNRRIDYSDIFTIMKQ